MTSSQSFAFRCTMGGCSSTSKSPVVMVAPAGSASPNVAEMLTAAALRARKRAVVPQPLAMPNGDEQGTFGSSSDILSLAGSPLLPQDKDSLTKGIMCVACAWVVCVRFSQGEADFLGECVCVCGGGVRSLEIPMRHTAMVHSANLDVLCPPTTQHHVWRFVSPLQHPGV